MRVRDAAFSKEITALSSLLEYRRKQSQEVRVDACADRCRTRAAVVEVVLPQVTQGRNEECR